MSVVREHLHMQEQPNQTSEEMHKVFCCTYKAGMGGHERRGTQYLNWSQECHGDMDTRNQERNNNDLKKYCISWQLNFY